MAAAVFWTVASSAAAQTHARSRRRESYSWYVDHVPGLATNPPPKSVVEAFQKEQYGEVAHLCSFRFADLRHSGYLSLVTTFDDGEARMSRCQAVNIFDKTPAGFITTFQIMGSINGADVDRDMIRDLRGDGNLELIVNQDLTSYIPSEGCIASWPVICRWDGSEYVNASGEFKEFYRQTVGSLNQRIAAMSSAAKMPASPSPASVLDCLKMEVAKSERLLGSPPDAGLKDAIEWSRSADHVSRQRAVVVFGDMGTPEAIRYLRVLAADPNQDVANDARAALSLFGLAP